MDVAKSRARCGKAATYFSKAAPSSAVEVPAVLAKANYAEDDVVMTEADLPGRNDDRH